MRLSLFDRPGWTHVPLFEERLHPSSAILVRHQCSSPEAGDGHGGDIDYIQRFRASSDGGYAPTLDAVG
jgi:hypothetical protein